MIANRLTATLLLAGLLTWSGPALADIVIGVAGPFSGPNAGLGEQLKRGVQKAVDDFNATGGLNGERLTIELADDGCDPRKAVDVAMAFVSLGVKFVAGHYCSGASIPAAKIYADAGIVEISPASTHPKLTDDGLWNVIRVCPRDDAQGTAAAERVLEEFPSRKVAILNDESPAAVSLTNRFRDRLAAGGAVPVLDEAYKPGLKDYEELALRLRDAGTEIIYIGGSYVEAGQIIRAVRDTGSNARLISNDALVTEDFWKIAKEAAEGTLMTFTFDPQNFAEAGSVIERFKADDYNPEGFTLYAYAAVETWVSAATATGSTDSHRIAEWLRAGNRVRTVTGEISFDAKGDLSNPRFAWLRWDNGKYADEAIGQ